MPGNLQEISVPITLLEKQILADLHFGFASGKTERCLYQLQSEQAACVRVRAAGRSRSLSHKDVGGFLNFSHNSFQESE